MEVLRNLSLLIAAAGEEKNTKLAAPGKIVH
jgi:hypothetical protein